jgi:DNA-binding transcriptional MerR regulator
MNRPDTSAAYALQLFEPAADAVYSIEATARLVDVPRRTILLYCKQGLVSPVVDSQCAGYYFNDEAIRVLRRIEYLRTVCGINPTGVRLILELMKEVEDLQSEVRFHRGC